MKKVSQKEREEVATKGFLQDQDFVTKEFLQEQNFVTKDFLQQQNFVTKDFLQEQNFVTKDFLLDSLGAYATKDYLDIRLKEQTTDFKQYLDSLMEHQMHQLETLMEQMDERYVLRREWKKMGTL